MRCCSHGSLESVCLDVPRTGWEREFPQRQPGPCRRQQPKALALRRWEIKDVREAGLEVPWQPSVAAFLVPGSGCLPERQDSQRVSAWARASLSGPDPGALPLDCVVGEWGCMQWARVSM